MYCRQCGYSLGDREQYCSRCGAKMGKLAPRSFSVTFVEGGRVLGEVTIPTDHDASLTFGRSKDNDVVVDPPSHTVSAHHGRFEVQEGQLVMVDCGSTNGLYHNGMRADRIPLAVGDIVVVGIPQRGARRTIAIVGEGGKRWNLVDLMGRQSLSIGRTTDNDLVLPDQTVSSHHAILLRGTQGFWGITDLGSSNGTRLNGSYVVAETQLSAGSIIQLGNAQLVFLDSCLLVLAERQGVEIVASDLVRYRENHGMRRITCDHVSFRVKRGEFVAIVGGSGCGKTTLLNALNGSDPADEGKVFFDGTDLYANYDMLKASIGNVPQEDIVYDDLPLYEMLELAAKLRMQQDTTDDERQERVDEVIRLLELEHERTKKIGALSGGQKKRASIAVELLADPRLLFLDEPTSGLDPGIERKLMAALAEMAHEGRTIVLVTHTTLNLHLCDQVVFLGTGGKLCYAGPPQQALSFFDVTDFVDVYNKISGRPEVWEQQFAFNRPPVQADSQSGGAEDQGAAGHGAARFFRQCATLVKRECALLVADHMRTAILLLQAPLLAVLLGIVAGSDCFVWCEGTQSCLFALSCMAFWIGILDSVQEICKERTILRREYEGGISLFAYLTSKLSVLTLLCVIQSLLLISVFMLMLAITGSSLPNDPVFFVPLELFLTTFLTTCSAMCLGLFVSAVVRNSDRAIAVAPLLVMPQILFAGIVFQLNGFARPLSYFVSCHWAVEAYGTTADVNELPLQVYREKMKPPEGVYGDGPDKVTVTKEQHEEGMPVPDGLIEHKRNPMFDHSPQHLLLAWGVLFGFCLICIVGCAIALKVQLR